MSAVNPYQPPQASVADVAEAAVEHSTPKVWSVQGRLGRLRYFTYWLVAYWIFSLVITAASVAMAVLNHRDLFGLVAVVSATPFFVLTAMLMVRRSHDMGWSGWTILLCSIPFVFLIWLFKSGTSGANRFGPPPPPNSLSVKVTAILLSLLFVLGIVASVALPAYQTYVQRAKAAQQATEPSTRAPLADGEK